MKKGGVKKLVYKAGDALKPVVQQGIQTAAQMGSIMAPEFAPALNSLSAVANNYLDKPSDFQGKNGWKKAINVGAMGGISGSGFARPASMGYGFAKPASMGGAVVPHQPQELREVGLSSRTLLPPNHPALTHPFLPQRYMAPRVEGW